jgi:hypothetical protein
MGWEARQRAQGLVRHDRQGRSGRLDGRYLLVSRSAAGVRRSMDGRRYYYDGTSLRRAPHAARRAA